MYSTCLFCNGELGKNEAIEHFPVGRRLAFDAAKGRLWVVCRKCERWNLTPLEERWEAIEECERAYSDTRLRVSTEHIGLARLKEGLELVRIGEPQRPEMAAWRYGDQFGRRRRQRYLTYGGVAVAGGLIMFGGPLLGLGAGIGGPQIFNLFNAAHGIYKHRKIINLPTASHGTLGMRLTAANKAKLRAEGDEVILELDVVDTPGGDWYHYRRGSKRMELRGMDAVRAAGAILPSMNQGGGSTSEVTRAVSMLEETGDPLRLFHKAGTVLDRPREHDLFARKKLQPLHKLPTPGRLALEMAAHEDTERRALEGELHILEAAWKAADEIAGIADNLLLPDSVEADLTRLRASQDEEER